MAEISEVLTKLLARTNEGKVRWRSTAEDQTFLAVIGNNSVLVSSPEALMVPDVVLRILDKNGRELERIDSEVAENEGKVKLRQLYEKARSIALSVPKELDELLKELERI